MDKDLFTTFEVGDLCRVYHTTVINWINKGQLKAFTTPGKHRRIHKSDLVQFIQDFNIPLPPELRQTRKILVVDDDAAILKLLEKTFSKHLPKAELRLTSNGVDALVMVGKQVPDLIVLDVVMPGMDGIQVCQSLKANPGTKNIKIISITGETLSKQQEEFLLQNVDAVFHKPFSPLELARKAAIMIGVEEMAYGPR